jgi:hypothetical protein
MFSSARRLVPKHHLRLALAAAVAVCLATPPISASAANTRYASPTGGTAPCLQTSPCSLEHALSNAEGLGFFDTVLLAPGTYHPAGELNVESTFVTVAGEPGQPPPLIEAAGERGLFFQNTGTVRNVRIHSPPTTSYGLAMIGAESVAERIESTGEAGQACAFGSVTVRDSLCSTETSGGGAVTSSLAGTNISQELKLYNVTAIGAFGIVAVANTSATVKVAAVNTIARGTEFDIEALSQAPLTAHVEVVLSHSNFATAEEAGGATVSSPTENANQEAAPAFVDEAGGDYREAEGSPTRLAGDLAAVLPGELDLAGNPRTTNCAGTIGVDIGAYQYECPAPPAVTPPASGGSTTTVTPPPPVPPAKPRLSKLALKPAKFVVSGKPPKGHAKGTTISFTLSTAASVKLEVLGKTVKGKKKTVTLGTLTGVHGKAGANSVKFNGKVKGKPLVPGKYTLRATTGSSKPVTATFTVLAAPA